MDGALDPMSGWRGAPHTPLPSRGASEGPTRPRGRKRVLERPASRRASPQEPGAAGSQPRVASPLGEHDVGVGEEAVGGTPASRHGQLGAAAAVSASPAEKPLVVGGDPGEEGATGGDGGGGAVRARRW
jgi:hypothetical protein